MAAGARLPDPGRTFQTVRPPWLGIGMSSSSAHRGQRAGATARRSPSCSPSRSPSDAERAVVERLYDSSSPTLVLLLLETQPRPRGRSSSARPAGRCPCAAAGSRRLCAAGARWPATTSAECRAPGSRRSWLRWARRQRRVQPGQSVGRIPPGGRPTHARAPRHRRRSCRRTVASVEMLRRALELGTTTIAATPHLR